MAEEEQAQGSLCSVTHSANVWLQDTAVGTERRATENQDTREMPLGAVTLTGEARVSSSLATAIAEPWGTGLPKRKGQAGRGQ